MTFDHTSDQSFEYGGYSIFIPGGKAVEIRGVNDDKTVITRSDEGVEHRFIYVDESGSLTLQDHIFF